MIIMSCEVCGKTTNLKSCGQCLKANYCGREHQKQHWEEHKKWCTAAVAATVNSTRNGTYNFIGTENQSPIQHQEQSTESIINTIFQQTSPSSSNSTMIIGNSTPTDNLNFIQSQQPNDMLGISQTQPTTIHSMAMDNNQQQQNTILTAQDDSNDHQIFGDELSSVSNTIVTANQSSMMTYDQHQIQQQQECPNIQMVQNNNIQLQYPSPPYPTSANNNVRDAGVMGNLHKYCQIILNDMNKYGFCVIDDFLQNGDLILNEVSLLYDRGWFKAGQVVNMKANSNSQLVRGDKIIWVEGNERICTNIGFLVRILDSIVSRCNTMALGEFSKYRINRRTKAMIACYPGNNTQYVRHVDNPNNDGRCITSIYYLNKDYIRERDGGVLRLFPQMNDGIVANIEPRFNRVIFFWSDRRNPHEVMPSTRRRFAITVWYFDANERAKAIQKYKENTGLQCPNDKHLVPF